MISACTYGMYKQTYIKLNTHINIQIFTGFKSGQVTSFQIILGG